MATKPLLVKRHGKIEEFDERKLYASVYSAALNAHLGEQAAEGVADKTVRSIKKQISKKTHVTSSDLKTLVVEELGGEENDIAYLYRHHLDLC